MSTILGLALFLAFLYLFTQRKNRPMKTAMIVLMFWMAGQSAMTYSRGGLWSGLVAIGIAAFFLFRSPRFRVALLTGSLVFVPITKYLLIPALDHLSDGTLVARFQSFDTSGRDERAFADLDAFQENPLFGVGPGRPRPGDFRMSAHTEMTRLPAEHGIFGVGALMLLAWMSVRRLRKRPDLFAAAFATSFTAWALLTMAHSAMRLYAPAFAFGLAETILFLQPTVPNLRHQTPALPPSQESAKLDDPPTLRGPGPARELVSTELREPGPD